MADYVCTRMEITPSADAPDFALSADPPIRSRRVAVLRLVRTALSDLVWFAIVVILLGVGAAGSTAVWATDAKVRPKWQPSCDAPVLQCQSERYKWNRRR